MKTGTENRRTGDCPDGIQAALSSYSRDDESDLEDELYVPVFEDFEHVFAEYPYIGTANVAGEDCLILGYMIGPGYSQRYRIAGERVRQNCGLTTWEENGQDLKEKHFKNLKGRFPALERHEGSRKGIATRRFIRAIPLETGMIVRSWTTINGQRDIPNLHRFSVVTNEGTIRSFRDEGAMLQLRTEIRDEWLRQRGLKNG